MPKSEKSRPSFFRQCLNTQPYLAFYLGLIFLGAGVYFGHSVTSFVSNSRDVAVTVIEVESKKSDQGRVFRPVFETVLTDGTKKRFAGNFWSSPSVHAVGKVAVGRYSETSGKIASYEMIDAEKRFSDLLKIIGGASALFGGLILLYKRFRKKRVS